MKKHGILNGTGTMKKTIFSIALMAFVFSCEEPTPLPSSSASPPSMTIEEYKQKVDDIKERIDFYKREIERIRYEQIVTEC